MHYLTLLSLAYYPQIEKLAQRKKSVGVNRGEKNFFRVCHNFDIIDKICDTRKSS